MLFSVHWYQYSIFVAICDNNKQIKFLIILTQLGLQLLEEQFKQKISEREMELNRAHDENVQRLKAQFEAKINAQNNEIDQLGNDVRSKEEELKRVCSIFYSCRSSSLVVM